MKVNGSMNQPVRQPIPGVTPHPSLPATTPAPEPAAASLPDRLVETLREAGMEVSSARMFALAAELEAIGFPLSRITYEAVFRALFLSNNSVPLTPELLTGAILEGNHLYRRVEELRDAARVLLADRRIAGEIRSAVAALVRDLEALAGTETGVPMTGSALQASVEAAISQAGFPPNLPDSQNAVLLAAGGAAQTSALAESIGSLLRKSGMVFEWGLLAWYRAGADPGRLFELIHGDLKGALLGFLTAMESSGRKGRLPAKIKSLGENTRSLLDRVTASQISHLAENSGDRRSLAFQIPFGAAPGLLYAGIGVEGRKEPETKNLDTEHFSLAFEIETSNLGMVRAHLVVSGKTVSATFYLRDAAAKALAEEMAPEFRAFLDGRGYEPGSIRFGFARDESESMGGGEKTRRSLDVRG